MNDRFIALLSIFVLALGCAALQGQGAPQDQNRQELLNFIPDPLPVGAVAQGTASFYTPDTLYQSMDGGADIFLLYGVRTLLHLDLRAKAVDITVDIFDMGTPDTAFGMYAAERSPDEPYVSIGAEGYANKSALNFYQDRYYVKLTGFGDGADVMLDVLARAISARIGTTSAFPAILARLPAQNRKAHSEQYMPNDPLGHPFLGPAYVATYMLDGKENKVFVVVGRDEADARERFQQLKQNFVATGQCKDAPELGEGAIRASNSFEGSVIALTKGRYVVLILNPSAPGEGLLRKVAAVLK
jgi:hypothetical protein